MADTEETICLIWSRTTQKGYQQWGPAGVSCMSPAPCSHHSPACQFGVNGALVSWLVALQQGHSGLLWPPGGEEKLPSALKMNAPHPQRSLDGRPGENLFLLLGGGHQRKWESSAVTNRIGSVGFCSASTPPHAAPAVPPSIFPGKLFEWEETRAKRSPWGGKTVLLQCQAWPWEGAFV